MEVHARFRPLRSSAEFPLHISDIIRVIQRFTGRFFERFIGGIGLAVLMHMGFQPLVNLGHIARSQILVGLGTIQLQLMAELSGIEISQDVTLDRSSRTPSAHPAKSPLWATWA